MLLSHYLIGLARHIMSDSKKIVPIRSISFGNERWYYTLPDGSSVIHREDGPALVWYTGDTEWYFHGKLHRIGGPALEYVDLNYREWSVNGRLHRLDGPAIEDGKDNRYLWYYYGKRLPVSSQKEFEQILKLKAFW